MVHPDHETRIGAHRIFSAVLVPTSVCPRPSSGMPVPKKPADLQRTLSRTVSVLSSSSALFEKLRTDNKPSKENVNHANNNAMMNRIKSSYSRVYSVKNGPVPVPPTADVEPINSDKAVVCSQAFQYRLRSTHLCEEVISNGGCGLLVQPFFTWYNLGSTDSPSVCVN